jgi:hypothetical protein
VQTVACAICGKIGGGAELPISSTQTPATEAGCVWFGYLCARISLFSAHVDCMTGRQVGLWCSYTLPHSVWKKLFNFVKLLWAWQLPVGRERVVRMPFPSCYMCTRSASIGPPCPWCGDGTCTVSGQNPICGHWAVFASALVHRRPLQISRL